MFKKIGILSGGGDVQGINAVIASSVSYGTKHNYKFVGFEKGMEGVLDMKYIELDSNSVRGISHEGGTILHSVNKGRFNAKKGVGDENAIDPDILELARSNIEKLELEALIVIGGDGTLTGAKQLGNLGVNIIGVPKTIDNDLESTDQTFGFSTAVSVAVDALDRIHTTAASHDRVMFVETMGRHAGWIALHAGLAGGADAILLPEFEFSYEGLIKFLRWRKTVGRYYSVVVVAEGAHAMAENLVADTSDQTAEMHLGGISDQIMKKVEKMAPGEFEMRNVVLGHIQRGGSPNAEDRNLAKTYGVSAIDAVMQGKFGHMVALQNGEIKFVPIEEAVEKLKLVTEDSIEFQTCKKLGVFLGQ